MSPKPARLTWMLAAGAAVVLAGAVAAWPEFLTAQHLDRLRRDPALLGGLLETGSPAEFAALRRFVRDRAGREEMLRIYLGGAGEYLHLDYRLLRGQETIEGVFVRTSEQQMWLTWGPRREQRYSKRLHWSLESSAMLIEVLTECCGSARTSGRRGRRSYLRAPQTR